MSLLDPTANELVLSPGINENPEIAIANFQDVVAATITAAQFAILKGKTPRRFIKTRPGKGGKIFSYVPHGYVVSVLNRAFGFDWDIETVKSGDDWFRVMPEQMGTDRRGKEVVFQNASVLVNVRLTVRVRNPLDLSQVIATITKTATGEKEVIRGMSWGGMVKSAESDGFKKAASKLGVALDLYWQDADQDYEAPAMPLAERVNNLSAAGEVMAGMMVVLRDEGYATNPVEVKKLLEALK